MTQGLCYIGFFMVGMDRIKFFDASGFFKMAGFFTKWIFKQAWTYFFSFGVCPCGQGLPFEPIGRV